MVTSLEQFIVKIKKIEPCSEGYVRFYRGQSVDKPLLPNVFREQSFIINESEIYNEIINKKPEEFGHCKCTFDYLVKMQHYNIPTRLLDITSNPLIAAYFACSGDVKESTVYCLDIPANRIKNYTSDSVTILATLARYDYDSKKELIEQVFVLGKFREIILNSLITIDREALKEICRKISSPENLGLKQSELYNKLVKELSSCFADQNMGLLVYKYTKKTFLDILKSILDGLGGVDYTFMWFGDSDMLGHILSIHIDKELSRVKDSGLLHEVKQDKPYFQDLMHIDTFNTIYCVKPRLDNPRIIKQNGAFLIFPNPEVSLENDMKISKIKIDKGCVLSILEDLSLFDINKESLFNDMDTVSLAIKDKYRKTN